MYGTAGRVNINILFFLREPGKKLPVFFINTAYEVPGTFSRFLRVNFF